jgi:hypothetical protein
MDGCKKTRMGKRKAREALYTQRPKNYDTTSAISTMLEGSVLRAAFVTRFERAL